MNLRIISGFAAIVCISLAACHPYDESKKKPVKGPDKTAPTADELKKKQEEETKKKQEEELKKSQEPSTGTTTNPNGSNPTGDLPKPPVEPKRDYAFAQKVPGKDGFVFSPYNNKVVDVRDIPSGTLVQDPTYPAAEKKYFRVP